MKLAGIVILYYPDQDLSTRIDSYLGCVEKLYVIDNSETRHAEPMLDAKIEWWSDGQNKGISSRINEATAKAIEAGFEWLLMMDQDSLFSPENLIRYLSCVNNMADKDSVAQFGVSFIETTNAATETTDIRADCTFRGNNLLITSGSLLNLSIFQKIGPFNEYLFIDGVDFEYCLRANMAGFKNIQFQGVYLNHSLGVKSSHRSFKTAKKTVRSLHSPLRMYYMTRNYLYLKSQFGKIFPAEITHMRNDLKNRLKNNFLYGNERIQLVAKVIEGWLDFHRKKFGKYR